MRQWCPWILVAALAAVVWAASAAGDESPAANDEQAAAEPAPRVAKPSVHLRWMGPLALASALAGVAAGSVGMMLLTAAAAPARVARAEQVLRRGRWPAVIVGVLSTVVLFGVALLLFHAAEAGASGLGVVGLLLLGLLVWLLFFGLTAVAGLIGERLLGVSSSEAVAPWRRVGLGGLAVGGTFLVPIFGWVCLLYLACRGIGAATLAFVPTGDSDSQDLASAPAEDTPQPTQRKRQRPTSP